MDLDFLIVLEGINHLEAEFQDLPYLSGYKTGFSPL